MVYNLEEVDTDELADISSESDLIPTSESIKNIEVVFEEVNVETGEIEEEDFIINEVTSMPSEDSFEAIQEEDQTMLTFDLPISNKPSISESEEVEVFTLEDTCCK